MGSHLRVGQVYRYATGKDPKPVELEGYPNFHHVTHSPELPRALLEAGINGMAKVRTPRGERRPVILVRSSPWKAGTEQTPWHDMFDMDNGHVRYFGDHKASTTVTPGKTIGNAALLDAFAGHQGHTPEERAGAVPLLLFRAVSRSGKVKGHVEFCGLGIIERAERLVQWGGSDHTTFTNYVYDIALLDLTDEDVRGAGNSYVEGWLTQRSGDGGADFVGRLDIGSGLAGTSLVVLGQAKCVRLDHVVSADQIARVVARLRRGWIGVYVTTGAYSVPAQTEMVEDQYPIVLVNGLDLTRELRGMARDDHGGDLEACIEHILRVRETAVTNRRPEEILLE
ncbi:restriction endonuclease [Streptomyces sp. NPDC056069]|uniref:restriction endonuclease n=1 Tax=Streptomyces sp. NPDC056069 TaxID=3345702 RepID=UPI0035D728A9